MSLQTSYLMAWQYGIPYLFPVYTIYNKTIVIMAKVRSSHKNGCLFFRNQHTSGRAYLLLTTAVFQAPPMNIGSQPAPGQQPPPSHPQPQYEYPGHPPPAGQPGMYPNPQGMPPNAVRFEQFS